MDLSDLDCPQYVKFPIEDFEMSCSMEDSLNVEKHHEDLCTDSSIPNDEEESFICIEESSTPTECSFSENEEHSYHRSRDDSEHVKSENIHDVSDICDSMVDSISEVISCTLDAVVVEVGSDADTEHVIGSNLPSHLFDQFESFVDSEANSCAADDIAIHLRSEANSDGTNYEILQNVSCNQIDSVVDSISKANSYAKEAIVVYVKPETDLEHRNKEITHNEVHENFDVVDLTSKETCCEMNAIVANVKSEANSEHDQEKTIQNDPLTLNAIVNHIKFEHTLDEKVINDVSDRMVGSFSAANICEIDSTVIPEQSETHFEQVKKKMGSIDVSGQFDHMIDSLAKDCFGAVVAHVKSHDGTEHVIDKNLSSNVSHEFNNYVDLLSKEDSCAVDNVIDVKSESDSKYVKDEMESNDDSGQFGNMVDTLSEAYTSATVVHVKSDANAEHVIDSNLPSDVSDQLNSFVDSEVNSCAADDIGIHMSSLNLEDGEMKESDSLKSRSHEETKVSSVLRATSSKTKHDAYVPLAQQVAAFHQHCPERYLMHRKNFQSYKHWVPPKYTPKSPNLQAAKRHREIKTNTEDVKRYKFHARPLNPKIFEKPALEAEKLSTHPKSFTLKTAQRAESHTKTENLETHKHEFHARPVPKTCHVKANEPGKVKIQSTKPKSPNFALKNREQKWNQRCTKTNDDTKQPNKVGQKQPKQLDQTISYVKQEKKPIEVLPFSFEEREKARQALKQQKAQELEKENSKPIFKAKEMPTFKPPALPTIPRKPITQPAPFTFLSETRISNQTKNEVAEVANVDFKPQLDNVLKPQQCNSKKIPTFSEAKRFQLHTEKRAAEWKEMEEFKKAEEIKRQQALEEYKAAKENQEQLEIMRIRQKAVHKANPIRAYKNVEIKHCNVVTQPYTPKFETDKRLQSRLDKSEMHF